MTQLAHKEPNRLGGILQPRRPLWALWALWVLCVLPLPACSSGPQPVSQAEAHRMFGQMQVHEARQEEAGRDLERADSCARRCEAHAELAREADHICTLADQLQDADALLRCRAARTRAAPSPPADCDCSGDEDAPA